MTRFAAAAAAAFLVVSGAAVVIGVGIVVERAFDLSLPTPLDVPPPVLWLVALVSAGLAKWLARLAGPGPDGG